METEIPPRPGLRRYVIPLSFVVIVVLWASYQLYNTWTNPKPAFTLDTDAVGTLSAAAISPDGRLLLTTRRFPSTGRILFWDTKTWEKTGDLDSPRGEITSLKFSRTGHLLVCSSNNGTIKIWDTSTWAEFATLNFNRPVSCADFSPDEKTLAIATEGSNSRSAKNGF